MELFDGFCFIKNSKWTWMNMNQIFSKESLLGMSIHSVCWFVLSVVFRILHLCWFWNGTTIFIEQLVYFKSERKPFKGVVAVYLPAQRPIVLSNVKKARTPRAASIWINALVFPSINPTDFTPICCNSETTTIQIIWLKYFSSFKVRRIPNATYWIDKSKPIESLNVAHCVSVTFNMT